MRRSAVLLPAIAVLAFSAAADARTRRAPPVMLAPSIAITNLGRAAAPVAIASPRIAPVRPMVGEWALEEDVRLGLGLYRVNRFSRREIDFKRNSAIREVGARTQRMPGVGLHLRF